MHRSKSEAVRAHGENGLVEPEDEGLAIDQGKDFTEGLVDFGPRQHAWVALAACGGSRSVCQGVFVAERTCRGLIVCLSCLPATSSSALVALALEPEPAVLAGPAPC